MTSTDRLEPGPPSGPGAPASIAVIGTGLIGTSIGLAGAGAGMRVAAWDPDLRTLDRAAGIAGLTPGGSVEDALRHAEVAFVCAPVPALPTEVLRCLEARGPVAVTDTGSVKGPVCDAVAERGGDRAVRFVGGHPMAGSERSGPDGAAAALFDDAPWVLTPGPATSPEALAAVRACVQAFGARPVEMDAERHDRVMAVISHLPQVVSSALMAFAANEEPLEPDVLTLAAGGFRDLTRLAASNPSLWEPILRANAAAVARELDRFASALGSVRDMLLADDSAALRELLEDGRRARLGLAAKPQVRAGVAILQVPIPDRPGVLARLTGAMGEREVNIEDLQIVHSPEGGRGSVHLTVAAAAADQALDVLEGAGFRAVRLA
ncbi:MAG TPA: prephenate dehydrogenase [Actinomycetota bacterium]